jgi:hypothetical protein
VSKRVHEVRDPIHVFVRLDTDERAVVDSRPFQRLRHIHQLALTYLFYPAATHKRFEHSLGVMELAGRVFDVVTNPAHGEHGHGIDVPMMHAGWASREFQTPMRRREKHPCSAHASSGVPDTMRRREKHPCSAHPSSDWHAPARS